ncbi:S-layer homology domain-containing protein [Paenibacillus andongensis]|uniref:S-layer homology domain-containing protein n=1 Tax=Paenibacillus andongensis TaxID=2975482 RepID=UPI0021BB5725|nr:S-layer homology domain-containing protein [Paenibacillus andongensis]
MSKSSSNIVRFNLKNKTKDIQGGEKKVMKKSLSVILSTAMALSMFSSVAFGKTSADFTDLKDLDAATKAKFDALISAGIFDGVSDTTFGLKDEMNRAQFAKVAALITGIEVKKDLKTSSFSDVKSDDAANGYALPYIEALKAAGITDGYGEGTYNPAGKVTKEQLATFLVRVLGKDADAKAKTGTDTTVSGWAQGYVALALELKLLPAGADGKFGGQANATRDLLLTGAYEAKAQYVSPGKVSLSEAKATGVQTVTVSFNKPVDTTKAVVALTKGTQSIATTAKWSDDKKSAVLTLTDVKISEGTYTATLSGLDAAGVDKTTATFTAENEKVTKLSFVNASDKIAKSISVTVKVKAENQYGENASLTGSNYTAYVAGANANVKRNDDTGLLELTLDTKNKPGTTPAADYQSEIDVIPVNIFLTNSSVSVQKTFKIGTEPYVTKIELGTAKYPATKTALTKDGDVAEVALTRYDQYGDVISDNTLYTTDFANRLKADAVITPYTFDSLVLDKTASTYDKLKFKLAKNVDKDADYTATVYVGSASATVAIKTQSSTVATKVEFGSFSGVLAEGDTNKYIPIVAYDAQGNKLSAQDIADNAKAGRFSVSISGASYATGNNGNDAIVQSGEHKGQIQLNSITSGSKGVVFVNFGIFNANIQQNVQQSFTVQDARKPETIVIDGSAPAAKGIIGGKSTIKWYVKDQHGEALDSISTVTGAKYTAANFTLKLTVSGATYATFTNNNTTTIATHTADGGVTYTFNATTFGDINKKELYLTGASIGGKGKLVAELIDNTKTGSPVIKSVETTLEVIAATDLTYSANALKDTYASLDSALVPADDKELTAAADTAATTTLSGVWAKHSKLAQKISVTAKDKSGDTVVIPGSRIVSASTANGSVAKAVYDAGDAWIIGNKAGTTNVTVVFNKANGEQQDVTLPINVKADAVTVSKITADANKTVSLATSTTYATTTLMNGIKVVDNYGVEYTFDVVDYIERYKSLLGVQYVISDVHGTTGAKVNISAGTVSIDAGVTEFVIKAIAPSGVSTSTLVKVTP